MMEKSKSQLRKKTSCSSYTTTGIRVYVPQTEPNAQLIDV